MRLTVVTTFGLIGTIVTGFLGMNLFALAQAPALDRVLYFVATLVPTVALTFYTIVKSKRLSDFLEAISDERLPRAREARQPHCRLEGSRTPQAGLTRVAPSIALYAALRSPFRRCIQ